MKRLIIIGLLLLTLPLVTAVNYTYWHDYHHPNEVWVNVNLTASTTLDLTIYTTGSTYTDDFDDIFNCGDDFDRADNAALGNGWTEANGGADLSIDDYRMKYDESGTLGYQLSYKSCTSGDLVYEWAVNTTDDNALHGQQFYPGFVDDTSETIRWGYINDGNVDIISSSTWQNIDAGGLVENTIFYAQTFWNSTNSTMSHNQHGNTAVSNSTPSEALFTKTLGGYGGGTTGPDTIHISNDATSNADGESYMYYYFTRVFRTNEPTVTCTANACTIDPGTESYENYQVKLTGDSITNGATLRVEEPSAAGATITGSITAPANNTNISNTTVHVDYLVNESLVTQGTGSATLFVDDVNTSYDSSISWNSTDTIDWSPSAEGTFEYYIRFAANSTVMTNTTKNNITIDWADTLNLTWNSPADNRHSANTTQKVWFDLSFTDSTVNCTMYVDNSSEDFTNGFATNSTKELNWGPSEGVHGYNVTCNSNYYTKTLSAITIVSDFTNPIATINAGNSLFASDNSTVINIGIEGDNENLTVTYSDTYMFAMWLNITNSSGDAIYNNGSTGLTCLDCNLTDTIDVTSWNTGVYTINFTGVDDHTANSIPPYAHRALASGREWTTDTGTTISVTAPGSTIDTTKLEDRYTFTASFTGDRASVVFLLTSTEPLHWRGNLWPYPVFVTGGAHWVDFNIDGMTDYNVVDQGYNPGQGTYSYQVRIDVSPRDTFHFTSIGGLNSVSEFYTMTIVNSTPTTYSAFTIEVLNSSQDVIGNESSMNASNLAAIEYMRLNFTAVNPDGVGNISFNYTANGTSACATGNIESACKNWDSGTWILFMNGTNTTYYNATTGGNVGDFINCSYTGTDTNRDYSCLIDEHYNPNIWKHYDANYDFTDVRWQDNSGQRVTKNTQLRVAVGATIPLDAPFYKLDFRVTDNGTAPLQPLEAWLCNSSYSTGDVTASAACGLIASHLPSDLDGTKFRALFTNNTIAALGDAAYIVLRTNENAAINYYSIKTYAVKAGSYTTQWNYSTDSGSTWTNLADGYETEMNINWFYNGSNVTQLVYNIFSTSNENYTTQSSDQTATWNLGLSNIAPLVSITNPNDGENLSLVIGNTSIDWSASDPNNDEYRVNITLVNASHIINLSLDIPEGTTSYAWDYSGITQGDYNLTVLAWENTTTGRLSTSVFNTITVDANIQIGQAYNLTVLAKNSVSVNLTWEVPAQYSNHTELWNTTHLIANITTVAGNTSTSDTGMGGLWSAFTDPVRNGYRIYVENATYIVSVNLSTTLDGGLDPSPSYVYIHNESNATVFTSSNTSGGNVTVGYQLAANSTYYITADCGGSACSKSQVSGGPHISYPLTAEGITYQAGCWATGCATTHSYAINKIIVSDTELNRSQNYTVTGLTAQTAYTFTVMNVYDAFGTHTRNGTNSSGNVVSLTTDGNGTFIFYLRNEDTSALILEEIEILVDGVNTSNIYTTSTGTYTAGNLSNGQYTVIASGENYTSRGTNLSVLGGPQNVTIYLPYLGSNVVFRTLDEYSTAPLVNASVGMFRIINGSNTLIETGFTDITGRIQFAYLDDRKYSFTLAKSGYESEGFSLNPILFSSYDIFMTPDLNETFSYAGGFTFMYAPKLFYDNQSVNVTLYMVSTPAYLAEWNFSLDYPGGSYIGSDSTATGGTLTHQVDIANASLFETVNVTIDVRNIFGEVYQYRYNHLVIGGGSETIINNRSELYGLGWFERVLILVLGAVVFGGLATLVAGAFFGLFVGLITIGLLTYILALPMIIIIPTMLVGLIIIAGRTGQ